MALRAAHAWPTDKLPCMTLAHTCKSASEAATMKNGGVASVLLLSMLSLDVLLLVAATAVSDDMDVIGLPSSGTSTGGFADLLMAVTRAAERGQERKRRPWRCCDEAMCTRSIPPICRCLDRVDRCSDRCETCEETEDSRRTCADWYRGDPGPRCKEDDGGRLADPGVTSFVDAAAAGKGDHETRPWKCCDQQLCTRSWPPICHCLDEVERCADACERCEEVEGSSSAGHGRFRCLDAHRGHPAPRCSRRGGTMMMQRAVFRGFGY